jgi:hypothetical protein
MALIVGIPPPGTMKAKGWGTSSNVLVGSIFISPGMSVSMGSTRSATTTVRYSGAISLRAVKTCSGPVRSNTVSPGYRTKAMVLVSFPSLGIQAPFRGVG